MYAIIETGGKQFKVKTGDIIKVGKLDIEAGGTYTIDKVLGIFDEGTSVFGSPNIKGASVTAEVLGNGKAKKVIIFKYKPKKGFRKKKGHRQPFTSIKIGEIKK